MRERCEALAEDGKTPLLFSENGRLLGVIAVADVIKPDSPQAVRELRNMGIEVVMLTGDNERTARAIGAAAGVDRVIAGVLPDGKEAEIRRLRERGTETEEKICGRMAVARRELGRAFRYDYVVLNDEVSEAVKRIHTIIDAEKMRYCRMENMIQEVLDEC